MEAAEQGDRLGTEGGELEEEGQVQDEANGGSPTPTGGSPAPAAAMPPGSGEKRARRDRWASDSSGSDTEDNVSGGCGGCMTREFCNCFTALSSFGRGIECLH